MALTATEQKEIRALILEMVARGCTEAQIDAAVRIAVASYWKLRQLAKQPAEAKK
ncbi:hypothetical protein NE850_27640 [Paraburkholderia sp. USG1]|uniref:hypothetical protein n=1 Tax=Paraburkholderia sp. USG1 TaxID=2952268 RepID=UPI00285DBA40|nr:hypothetical protein [Paraburkholderia sp. USG1]MDR8400087.1 hypothetical protein [Paraburkholderia sp. USG1]